MTAYWFPAYLFSVFNNKDILYEDNIHQYNNIFTFIKRTRATKNYIPNKPNSKYGNKKIRLEKVFSLSVLNNWLNIYLWYFCVILFGKNMWCHLNLLSVTIWALMILCLYNRKYVGIRNKGQKWILVFIHTTKTRMNISKWKFVFKFLNVITRPISYCLWHTKNILYNSIIP